MSNDPEQLDPAFSREIAQAMIGAELTAAGRRHRDRNEPGPSLNLVVQVAESCGVKVNELERRCGLSRPGTLNARKDRKDNRLEGCSTRDAQAFVLAIVASATDVRSLEGILSESLHLDDELGRQFRLLLQLRDLQTEKLIKVSKVGGVQVLTALAGAGEVLRDRERRAAWADRDGHAFYFDVDPKEAKRIHQAAIDMMSNVQTALISPAEDPGLGDRYQLAFEVKGAIPQRDARRSAERMWQQLRKDAGLKPLAGYVDWHKANGDAINAG